jgi:hypothetical protein
MAKPVPSIKRHLKGNSRLRHSTGSGKSLGSGIRLAGTSIWPKGQPMCVRRIALFDRTISDIARLCSFDASVYVTEVRF